MDPWLTATSSGWVLNIAVSLLKVTIVGCILHWRLFQVVTGSHIYPLVADTDLPDSGKLKSLSLSRCPPPPRPASPVAFHPVVFTLPPPTHSDSGSYTQQGGWECYITMTDSHGNHRTYSLSRQPLVHQTTVAILDNFNFPPPPRVTRREPPWRSNPRSDPLDLWIISRLYSSLLPLAITRATWIERGRLACNGQKHLSVAIALKSRAGRRSVKRPDTSHKSVAIFLAARSGPKKPNAVKESFQWLPGSSASR